MIEGIDPEELAALLDPTPVDHALDLLAAGDPDAPFTPEEHDAIAAVQGSMRSVIEMLEAAVAESLADGARQRHIAEEAEALRRQRVERRVAAVQAALPWAYLLLGCALALMIAWGMSKILG